MTKTNNNAEKTQAANVVMVPFAKLIEADNTRQTYTGIDELSENIAELGLLQYPTVVKVGEDAYRLEDGFRRARACRKLGWTHLPCIITAEGVANDDKDAMLQHKLRQLAATIVRDDFLPWELGAELKKVRDGNKLSLETLAKSVGLSKSHAGNCVAVVEKIEPAVLKTIIDAHNKGVRLTTAQLFRVAYANKGDNGAAEQAALAAELLKGEAPKAPKGDKGDKGDKGPAYVGTPTVQAVCDWLSKRGKKADMAIIDALAWAMGAEEPSGSIAEALVAIEATKAAERAQREQEREAAKQARAAEREAKAIEAAKERAAKLQAAADEAARLAAEKAAGTAPKANGKASKSAKKTPKTGARGKRGRA